MPEAPGINGKFLSDVYFNINGLSLGKWISPGDLVNSKGTYTPKWWYLTEYGKLSKSRLLLAGTYINDELVSNVTIGRTWFISE